MLIRSQDKTAIVNVSNVFDIGVRDINKGVAICIGSSSSYRNIAEYSTKEKALKVLDMIQDAYCKFMSVKNDDAWSGKEFVFYMPADSELEVWAEYKPD